MCPSDTSVDVTVVPMFAPMIMGTALASGSGLSGAATSATTIEVVTDELCMIVVASNPTINPMNGFSVVRKKLSRRSLPSSSKPSPSPLTPSRKTNNRRTMPAMRTTGSAVWRSTRAGGPVTASTS